MENDLSRAQADMRFAYCGGAAGVLASALVWASAAIVTANFSAARGMWTLLIGGMFIHPASMLISKLLGGTGNHSKDNPLASLAGASTVWLILSLALAYAASLVRIEWFFPAMLLIIGGRYTVFHSLYGLRIYWALGIVLAACGFLFAAQHVQPLISAFAGAAIEAFFGIAVLLTHRRSRVEIEA